MPEFYVKQGLKAGESINLPVKRIVVGRSSESTLLLPDDSVDLTHASLEYRGDRWILQDLGAPGGTWLNDEVVDKPCRIFDGDIILFGEIPIEVQGVGGALDLRDQSKGIKAQPKVQTSSPRQSRRRTYLFFMVLVLMLISLVFALLLISDVDVLRLFQ